MMKIIEKFAKHRPPIIINDLFRETVKAMDLPGGGLAKRIFTSKRFIGLGMWLARRMIGEEVDNIVYPLVQNNITPTVLRAGKKVNSIPGTCEVTLDARLLPGFERDELRQEIEKILGEKLFREIESETIMEQPGGLTPIGTEFYEQIGATIDEIDPGAKLVPVLSPGSTDLLHFRKKGIQAYGFFPLKIDEGITACGHHHLFRVRPEAVLPLRSALDGLPQLRDSHGVHIIGLPVVQGCLGSLLNGNRGVEVRLPYLEVEYPIASLLKGVRFGQDLEHRLALDPVGIL